jgi:hypothetical protein
MPNPSRKQSDLTLEKAAEFVRIGLGLENFPMVIRATRVFPPQNGQSNSISVPPTISTLLSLYEIPACKGAQPDRPAAPK